MNQKQEPNVVGFFLMNMLSLYELPGVHTGAVYMVWIYCYPV